MKKMTSAAFCAATMVIFAGAARAEMPVFSAECPQGNYIDADRTGTVRVNGNVASVQKFNENYYEAKFQGIIYPISQNDDGSGLLVGYNPPGSAGGYCTVKASAPSGSGGSASAGSGSERVSFAAGTSGAELTGVLAPGDSRRYILGANNGQDLYVRVATQAPMVEYQIFNPDKTFLLEQMTSAREYRGQLWQSGDHVIEVINRGNSEASYNVIFGID